MSNYAGWTHRPKSEGGTDPVNFAVWHILLTGDRDSDEDVAVEDHVVRPAITADMSGLRLKRVVISLGVASASGAVEFMIVNETQAVDMLSSVASLASGSQYADESANIAAAPDNVVTEGDIIAVNITAAGSGAKGLKAMLAFTG